MLQRVILNLIRQGFDDITVNIHHFGEQIIEFLKQNSFDAKIQISDEREMILDTGGAIVGAMPQLCLDDEPILIHNVDILSNADLAGFYREHKNSDADCSLLVSNRNSSRKLLFSEDMRMHGWTNVGDGTILPPTLSDTASLTPLAFSGIYCINPSVCSDMKAAIAKKVFPIMDYFIYNCERIAIKGIKAPGLEVLDIGKPDRLANATEFLRKLG